MLWQCAKPAAKRFFPLPDEIFSLGLSSGALAVYSYLLYCEDRKTYQCWPSYGSIGKAVRMSVNTVRKYVADLEERGLVVTESTSFTTRGTQAQRHSALHHPTDSKRGGPPQPTPAPAAGGNDGTNASRKEVGGQQGTPRMSTCEPLCAILPLRAGQNPWGKFRAKTRRFTRDERKAG